MQRQVFRLRFSSNSKCSKAIRSRPSSPKRRLITRKREGHGGIRARPEKSSRDSIEILTGSTLPIDSRPCGTCIGPGTDSLCGSFPVYEGDGQPFGRSASPPASLHLEEPAPGLLLSYGNRAAQCARIRIQKITSAIRTKYTP
jgi:hypothetical protein